MQIFMVLTTAPFGPVSFSPPRQDTRCTHRTCPTLSLPPWAMGFAPVHWSSQYGSSGIKKGGSVLRFHGRLSRPSSPLPPKREGSLHTTLPLPAEALCEPVQFTRIAERDAVWGQEEEGSWFVFFFFRCHFSRLNEFTASSDKCWKWLDAAGARSRGQGRAKPCLFSPSHPMKSHPGTTARRYLKTK